MAGHVLARQSSPSQLLLFIGFASSLGYGPSEAFESISFSLTQDHLIIFAFQIHSKAAFYLDQKCFPLLNLSRKFAVSEC